MMNEMWLGIGPTHRTLNMNLLIRVMKPLKSLENSPTSSRVFISAYMVMGMENGKNTGLEKMGDQ
ncbi:hypothetical protein DY000_02018125 [Brassica cretica]|uniref:Uncharacterized protein n=1 Tax=Brassica cretica TaxID=69181 RepID=A0ABQ7CRT6_BRACR|nr:hypothetical protein DY000_02018125 [Brassica cretica]